MIDLLLETPEELWMRVGDGLLLKNALSCLPVPYQTKLGREPADDTQLVSK